MISRTGAPLPNFYLLLRTVYKTIISIRLKKVSEAWIRKRTSIIEKVVKKSWFFVKVQGAFSWGCSIKGPSMERRKEQMACTHAPDLPLFFFTYGTKKLFILDRWWKTCFFLCCCLIPFIIFWYKIHDPSIHFFPAYKFQVFKLRNFTEFFFLVKLIKFLKYIYCFATKFAFL